MLPLTKRVAALAVGVGLLLAGCGGDSEPKDKTDAGKAPLVAALGDSITAGFPRWDPRAKNRRLIVRKLHAKLDRRNQYVYWAPRSADGRVRFRNCGVGGNTTGQMRRRFDRCVKGAQALLVQGGGNDISKSYFRAGFPYRTDYKARLPRQLDRGLAQAGRNIEWMVRRGKKLGLKVMIAEVIPFSLPGGLSIGRAARRLNRIIHRIGKRNDVEVLPFYETLEDPGKPGFPDPELTEDFVHPSVEGHRRLGELFRYSSTIRELDD
jgi:lysophospholipase L1-like esterase